MRTRAWTAALVALACAPEEAPKAPSGYDLRPVVAPRIAALESEIGPDAPAPEPDAETTEQVRGLIEGYGEADARMRKVFAEEVGGIGDPALSVLAACIADASAPEAQRLAAVELAGAIDTPRGAELLVGKVETAAEPWLRANAAFQLSRSTQDQVVPRLLLRLKYEIDGDSVIWIASALAHFGNWAGVDGLGVLAGRTATDGSPANAVARLRTLAEEAGVESGDRLWELWNSGDPDRRLVRKEPSPRHRLEIWRTIERLLRQDLRAVDDARFVLSRGAAWVAEPLAESLHDAEVYTRTHAAQSLERMGPRAASAGPELAAALGDPRLAPAAAAALGAIGWKPAADLLVKSLDERADPELRNAAARALGVLGDPAAIEPLRGLLTPGNPIDLRQAAAGSLVALGRGEEAARVLLECMTSPRADASAAEADLERWLTARAEGGDEAARTALESWKALAPSESEARHRERSQVVEPLVPIVSSPPRAGGTAR